MKNWLPCLALCGGCAGSPASSDPSETIAPTPPSSSVDSHAPVAAKPAFSGWLHLTKGAQPLIGGRLLASETMVTFFGEDWRDLKGRRFRVFGRKHDHECDPDAQCMTDGVIPTVRDVTSVELCRGCQPAPPHVKTVTCEKDTEGCFAICDRRGAECRERVAGNERHLERCGSQHSDCREGCQLHGEPDPYCR